MQFRLLVFITGLMILKFGVLPAGNPGLMAESAEKAPAKSKSIHTEKVVLDNEFYRVEWLHREAFDDTWSSRWVVEGNSEIQLKEGKLLVRDAKPGQPCQATLWYRCDLPGNCIVRFHAGVVPPAENNAANLNIFLHARELDGTPLRFGRDGTYQDYHKIPNYIVTLTGGSQPGWSRVRRDPGFRILHEASVRSEVGKDYRIAITLQKGRLRYYLNGRKIHDIQDPEPLSGGKFALRTWSTNAWWDDIEFGRIVD